jgi:hypothetical protein
MAEPISAPTIVPISTAVAAAMTEDAQGEDEARSAPGQNPSTSQHRGLKAGRDAEIDAPVPPDTEPKGDQPPFTLRDIRVGKKDGRGVPITQVYAAESGQYAIYQAGEVIVHFADDPEKEHAQRKAILKVSSARAEVNALLQGLACREICDRQLAYALQLALDGDIEGAKATIAGRKGFRNSKACRTRSLPVFEMELRGRRGAHWTAVRGQPVLSVPSTFEQPLACGQGGFSRCGFLHRARDPGKNGRPRYRPVGQCD